MSLPGLALGVVIGLSPGLLEDGDSIFTMPVFVYVLGFAAKEGIAMKSATGLSGYPGQVEVAWAVIGAAAPSPTWRESQP